MPAMDGPDFLCIGMHKCGTQWLYDQLQEHPDFWMPPIKEMHYLELGDRAGLNAQKIRDGKRSSSRIDKQRWDDLHDPRDRAFIEEMAACYGRPLDLERYAALFRHKGGLISGDITPQYGAIEEDLVESVARRFPRTKIVLLIRDPVSRMWSQISQRGRKDRFNQRLLDDPARFRRFYERKRSLQKYASITHVSERWARHVGEARLHHFFFDDIAGRPVQARHDILTALGADPAKPSGNLPADYNPKTSQSKLKLTPEIQAVLAESFKDELKACAARFGSHAIKWPARYGY